MSMPRTASHKRQSRGPKASRRIRGRPRRPRPLWRRSFLLGSLGEEKGRQVTSSLPAVGQAWRHRAGAPRSFIGRQGGADHGNKSRGRGWPVCCHGGREGSRSVMETGAAGAAQSERPICRPRPAPSPSLGPCLVAVGGQAPTKETVSSRAASSAYSDRAPLRRQPAPVERFVAGCPRLGNSRMMVVAPVSWPVGA